MTCRHAKGDPSCSSTPGYRYDREEPKTPDAEKYYVVDVLRCGEHLVMKVKYPNCASCAYEGNKVLVFLNVTETQALRWRRIDPHFRKASIKGIVDVSSAPSPAARFPASDEGWIDAVEYAKRKSKS